MIPRDLLNRYDSTETLIGRCMIPRELLRHIHTQPTNNQPTDQHTITFTYT